MGPNQWGAELVTGFVLGTLFGFWLAYVALPWLAHQWNVLRFRRIVNVRRLLGRRDA